MKVYHVFEDTFYYLFKL